MSEVEANLFSLQSNTAPGSWVYGQVYASGSVSAGAAWHRGIDLSAKIDINAGLEGEVKHGVEASLAAGAGVKAGLSLQAAFPLDLFKEAGVVARFQAPAAAGAGVGAHEGRPRPPIQAALRAQVPPALRPYVDIFLSEILIGAGCWGRVSFAAEVLAEAVAVGRLLRGRDGTPPGFTCSVQWGAGLGYGAGMQFLANIGFKDSHRLIERLARAMAESLARELEPKLEDLPAVGADAARVGLTFLRLLLPLAARASFDLAEALLHPSTDRQGAAGKAVAEAFARQVQDLLLRALFNFAITELGRLLDADVDPLALDTLDAGPREHLVEGLRRTRAILARFSALEQADLQGLVELALELLGPASELLQVLPMQESAREDGLEALGIAWCAATLLTHVVGWNKRSPPSPDAAFPPPAAASAVAAHVAGALGKAPDAALTLADALRFLLRKERLEALAAAAPALAPVLGWLRQALAMGEGEDLLALVLNGLLDTSAGNVRERIAALGPALDAALSQHVYPRVLEPLAAQSPEAEELIRRVVRPTLASLTDVIMTGLAGIGSEQAASRLREQLSATLLLFVGRLLLASTSVLLSRALEEGAERLREVGNAVVSGNGGDPVFNALAAVAHSSVLGFSLTPRDVKGVLDLTADTVEVWNQQEREPIFDLLEAIITLGLSEPGQADASETWRTLARTNEPARRQELEALLYRLQASGWRVMEHVAPRALELFAGYYIQLGETVLALAEQGAKEVVRAVKGAIAWLGQRIEELRALARQLLEQAQALAASIAWKLSELSGWLAARVDAVVGAIREEGWRLVDPLINDRALGWLQEHVRQVYDRAFDGLAYLLATPLRILSEAAGWVHDVLQHQIQAGAVDRGALERAIRERAINWGAFDLHFPVRVDMPWPVPDVDLGTVTLPAGQVLRVITDAIFGDLAVAARLDEVVGEGARLSSKRSELAVTQAAAASYLTQEQAKAAVGQLTTGKPLAVRIEGPADGGTVEAGAPVRIAISGANRTFVSTVLGVPRRVEVRVNNRPYAYATEAWVETPDGIAFEASLQAGTLGFAAREQPAAASADFLPVVGTLLREAAESARSTRGKGTRRRPGKPRPPVMLPVLDRAGGDPRLLVSLATVDGATTLAHVPLEPHSRRASATSRAPRAAVGPTLAAAGMGPVLALRPGINTLQVLVVDGEGRRQQVVRTFFYRPAEVRPPPRTNAIHVVPRNRAWVVVREHEAQPLSVHRTQKAAEQAGRNVAKQDRVEFLLHGLNGRIRLRDSYGHDPHPPRG